MIKAGNDLHETVEFLAELRMIHNFKTTLTARASEETPGLIFRVAFRLSRRPPNLRASVRFLSRQHGKTPCE